MREKENLESIEKFDDSEEKKMSNKLTEIENRLKEFERKFKKAIEQQTENDKDISVYLILGEIRSSISSIDNQLSKVSQVFENQLEKVNQTIERNKNEVIPQEIKKYLDTQIRNQSIEIKKSIFLIGIIGIVATVIILFSAISIFQ